MRISKYKNIFAYGYVPNWSGKDYVIKKLEILCYRHVIRGFNGEEINGNFYEK